MSKLVIIRWILSSTFFLSIFFGVWWWAPLLGALILVRFNAPEIIFGAVLMDLLYTGSSGFFGFPAVWTVLFVVLFFAFKLLRSKLF